MRELVVISGKGGTGKTTLTASLAVLAGTAVVADCDVDGADLHLLLHPAVQREEPFIAGHVASIRSAACGACGTCSQVCRFDAVVADGDRVQVDPMACEGCGVCVDACPEAAIDLISRRSGAWFVSTTRVGSMVHARLDPGAESSGKLVTTVRQQARTIAEQEAVPLLLTDGPPGIGCPVIASLSGASQVLAVTEPTVAGLHDLERLLDLAAHFGVGARVCVNRWDLNPEMSARIEQVAARRGADAVGRIRFDESVVRAQLGGRTPVEDGNGGGAGTDIRALWRELSCQGGTSERTSR